MPAPLGPPPIRTSLNTPELPAVWAEFFRTLQQQLAVIVAGALRPTYTAQTTTYTAVANDLVACTSGTFTVTLPLASANLNQVIWVVNHGSGTITVGRTGADTVGLATSQTLNTGGAGRQGDAMVFISDGLSNWAIV